MWKLETYASSWLESFDVLKLDSLKLLLLVSVRSLLSVYRSLLHAWFLPVALLVGLVLSLPGLLAAFYTTLYIRAARPSLDFKNAHYWQQTEYADWIVFFTLLIIAFAPCTFALSEPSSGPLVFFYKGVELLFHILFLRSYVWLPGTQELGALQHFLSPLVILWILFMLDARKAFLPYVQASGRALLMVLYNYPFFLITYLAFRGILAIGYLSSQPFMEAFPHLGIVGWLFLLVILLPYYFCFLVNFYVKRLHEQFYLYYRS